MLEYVLEEIEYFLPQNLEFWFKCSTGACRQLRLMLMAVLCPYQEMSEKIWPSLHTPFMSGINVHFCCTENNPPQQKKQHKHAKNHQLRADWLLWMFAALWIMAVELFSIIYFQGDILRMEKEHQVLKEQLKEAQEKYEQLQSRSSEEISVLKELIKKSVEETKVMFLSMRWWG